VRLSWNEIRARAAHFADEWRGAHYEKGETQTFYNEFFEIFGITRRRVASYEEPVKKLGDRRGFIDLFWKGVLLVEQKSAGRDLAKAKEQAYDYFPGLKESELPRYLLISDFQNLELYDLDEGTESKFALWQLPQRIEDFAFILGVQKRSFKDQDPVNIEASELMGRLHDALKASGYAGHELERFLVRLLFCLFADDTGIFEPRDIFLSLVQERTQVDGSDLGHWLAHLFEVLNTPDEDRQTNLDADLAQFPYINGDLFAERLLIPAFDAPMRFLLIEACEFSWDAISPAIFGSLFQSVMNPKQRRAQGAHYTPEKSILKVIQPLFLDDLRAEFERLKSRRDTGRRGALQAFHERLGALRFLDPACGCGNFLIIAYRELRALEIELLKEVFPQGQRELDVARLSRINVNQFYGIEIDEFPARIAETALWMMDHIMNNRLSLEFGQSYLRIPLTTSPHIRNADALEIEWEAVLPASECSFVLGNPPFGGFVFRDEARQAQLQILARLGATGSRLDFVAAWFLKAAEYVRRSTAAVGFVATNSLTQGEQVAQLWPALFGRYGLEISFAHRTFAWASDARGKAHVHVVIIGLTRRGQEPPIKRLFSYDKVDGDPVESEHGALTAYLFGAETVGNRHLVVTRRTTSLGDVPLPHVGSKPVDGGHYIVTGPERVELLKTHPDLAPFIRPYVGGEEFLNGGDRWIFCLQTARPEQLRAWPEVRARVELVRSYRDQEGGKLAKSLAATPTEFHVTSVPESPFLAIPEVSSERREYIPIGWLAPPVVPSNQLIIIEKASPEIFAIISSRMHMVWMRFIGGRLESRYRYSTGIVYNNFPWPKLADTQRQRLASLAQDILDARARFPGATLSDLYDTDLMKPALRHAHRALDATVDRLYRRRAPFSSDRERVEHLFGLYEKLVAPLAPAPRVAGRRVRPARRAAAVAHQPAGN
jgi:hypothetical protein